MKHVSGTIQFCRAVRHKIQAIKLLADLETVDWLGLAAGAQEHSREGFGSYLRKFKVQGNALSCLRVQRLKKVLCLKTGDSVGASATQKRLGPLQEISFTFTFETWCQKGDPGYLLYF